MANYASIVGTVLLGVAGFAGLGAALGGLAGRREVARWGSLAAALALAAATAVLLSAIFSLDFSYEYVASQSRARSGGVYRLAALWGGAEGSLLFFAALLGITAAFALWRYDLGRWGLAAPPAVMASLAATTMLAANPFGRASLPAVRGAGLTPILEHPAMLYHPPILYLGLVATLVPFLLMLDAPRREGGRVALVRRWILAAWTLLTVGLATGANWAYVELGWGGYWAWDPVENTVLMPWLVLTAAVHVLRSRALVAGWPRLAVASALTPFVLVLFGAAVTRSGGLSSVHAFADAEALGWSLGLLTAVVAVAVFVLLSRMQVRPASAQPKPFANIAPVSLFLGVSAVFAGFMTVVVLMGVGLPLLPGSNRIVTADFYNRVGTPVLVLVLLALFAFPAWTALDWRRSLAAAIGAVVVAVSTGMVLDIDDWLRWSVLAVGAMALAGHFVEVRRIPLATTVGHVGFVVLAFAMASSAQADTVAVVLAPGESVEFGSRNAFVYQSFAVTDGPRSGSEAVTVQAVITDRDGREVVAVQPALVSYPDRGVALAETALHSTPARDIQVVLRTVTDDGLGSFELSERPALMLVWWGAALIALAGVLALLRARQCPSARHTDTRGVSRHTDTKRSFVFGVGAAFAGEEGIEG